MVWFHNLESCRDCPIFLQFKLKLPFLKYPCDWFESYLPFTLYDHKMVYYSLSILSTTLNINGINLAIRPYMANIFQMPESYLFSIRKIRVKIAWPAECDLFHDVWLLMMHESSENVTQERKVCNRHSIPMIAMTFLLMTFWSDGN